MLLDLADLAVLKRLAGLQLDPRHPAFDADAVGLGVDDLLVRQGVDLAPLVAVAVQTRILSVVDGAHILAVAEWNAADNGAEQLSTLRLWLEEAEDEVKVGLALLQEWYPFQTHARMSKVLNRVARRFPRWRDRCNDLIARRAKIDSS